MHPRHGLLIAMMILVLLPLAACDDNDVTLGPTAPTGPLIVQSSGSATQIEPNDGFRVQVRMRVTSGLDSLAQAVRSGAARGQVCMSGTCDDSSLSPVFGEGVCAGLPMIPAGDLRLGIAVAWMDGDSAGIDFCMENLTGEATFETSISDGLNNSNVIRTTCAAGSTCFSG